MNDKVYTLKPVKVHLDGDDCNGAQCFGKRDISHGYSRLADV